MGPIKPLPSFTRLTANVRGGPIKFMLYRLVSVQIRISWRDLIPPTMKDPVDNRTLPALFVAVGSKSSSFSESEKATNIGSIVPVLEPLDIGSAPNTTRWRSVSDVMTCKATVGTRLAPEIPDNCKALVDVPLFSSHLNMPAPLGLMIRFSPKLS